MGINILRACSVYPHQLIKKSAIISILLNLHFCFSHIYSSHPRMSRCLCSMPHPSRLSQVLKLNSTKHELLVKSLLTKLCFFWFDKSYLHQQQFRSAKLTSSLLLFWEFNLLAFYLIYNIHPFKMDVLVWLDIQAERKIKTYNTSCLKVNNMWEPYVSLFDFEEEVINMLNGCFSSCAKYWERSHILELIFSFKWTWFWHCPER